MVRAAAPSSREDHSPLCSAPTLATRYASVQWLWATALPLRATVAAAFGLACLAIQLQRHLDQQLDRLALIAQGRGKLRKQLFV